MEHLRGYGVRCDTCGAQVWTDQKNGILPKTIPLPPTWITMNIDKVTTYHCSFECVEMYHKYPVFEE